MRKLITLSALFLALMITNPVSADFYDGQDAYEAGDYAMALSAWTPVAEQGNAMAQYNLGVMYDNGQGTPQDYKAAFKWYKLAAEQGDASALYVIGVMYDNGQGIPQDYKTAYKWYKRAAEKGDPTAPYNLGVLYDNGDGIEQDLALAHMWYNIAASYGNRDAVENRDSIEKKMKPVQLEAAQKLARDCVEKQYMGC